jgi:hypothetical protein
VVVKFITSTSSSITILCRFNYHTSLNEMTLHIRCPPLTIFSYEKNIYTERMQLLHTYREIPHFQMTKCRKISSYIREDAAYYFYIQLFYVFFFFMLSKFCKRRKILVASTKQRQNFPQANY